MRATSFTIYNVPSRQVCVWVFVVCCVVAGRAAAQERSQLVARAAAGQIRVDGTLGEWRGVRAARIGDEPSGSAEARLAYDDSGLYVGARVRDDAFVRSAHPSAREDALVVRLALPDHGELHTQLVWLYAGDIGRTRAAIMLSDSLAGAQREISGAASIVEGPSDGGYVIEAFLPWSALRGGADFQLARGSLHLHDVDRAGAAAELLPALRDERAERLPWLDFDGGVTSAIVAVLQSKNLASTAPKLDELRDVHGDAHAERVIVVGNFVLVSGNGARVAIDDLPVSAAADVRAASLMDLDGDARPELVLTLRQRNDLGARELWQAYDLKGGRARATFAIETRKETSAGAISASVSVSRNARAKRIEIEVSAGEARGLSPETYTEAPASGGVEPMLLPWGPVSQRTYAWDGSRFAVVGERKNPKALEPQVKPAPPAASAPRAAPVETVVYEAPPGIDELVAAYKQARGVAPQTAARFTTHANLAEDKRIESLFVFGSDLVVVGEGFRGGLGYFFFGLPVAQPQDVLRVFTGDVTGDGRRDVFVRVRQRIGDVQREILLGYTFTPDGIAPLVSVEVRRARGADSVGNVVSLVRDGKRFALRISPGFAHGWSAETYPFTAESLDATGALLLPWKDAALQYRFDGRALVGD